MSDNEKPLTKHDLLEALSGLEQRLSAIERKLEALQPVKAHPTEIRNTAYEQRLNYLEKFVGNTTERFAHLEAPDRLFELMLRVSELERKLNRPQ